MEDCLFCKIIHHEVPSFIIREDEETFTSARKTGLLLEKTFPEIERIIVIIEGLAIPHLHIRLHPHIYGTNTLVGGEGKREEEGELKRIYNRLIS